MDVAGHCVSYDPQRKLWYCDIVFDNPSVYRPFVRLAWRGISPIRCPARSYRRWCWPISRGSRPIVRPALGVNPADSRQARVFVGGLAPEGPTRPVITVTVGAGWRMS